MSKKRRRMAFLATELEAASDRMTPARREYLSRFVEKDIPPDIEKLIEHLTPMPDSPLAASLIVDLRRAVKAGFLLAVARYGRELKSNREAMAIIEGRRQGSVKGRDTQKQTKANRAARAQAMLNAGIDVAAIARELKCSISTVYRYLKPAAARPAATKPCKQGARSGSR